MHLWRQQSSEAPELSSSSGSDDEALGGLKKPVKRILTKVGISRNSVSSPQGGERCRGRRGAPSREAHTTRTHVRTRRWWHRNYASGSPLTAATSAPFSGSTQSSRSGDRLQKDSLTKSTTSMYDDDDDDFENLSDEDILKVRAPACMGCARTQTTILLLAGESTRAGPLDRARCRRATDLPPLGSCALLQSTDLSFADARGDPPSVSKSAHVSLVRKGGPGRADGDGLGWSSLHGGRHGTQNCAMPCPARGICPRGAPPCPPGMRRGTWACGACKPPPRPARSVHRRSMTCHARRSSFGRFSWPTTRISSWTFIAPGATRMSS